MKIRIGLTLLLSVFLLSACSTSDNKINTEVVEKLGINCPVPKESPARTDTTDIHTHEDGTVEVIFLDKKGYELLQISCSEEAGIVETTRSGIESNISLYEKTDHNGYVIYTPVENHARISIIFRENAVVIVGANFLEGD